MAHHDHRSCVVHAGLGLIALLLTSGSAHAQMIKVAPESELADAGSMRVLVTINAPQPADNVQVDVMVPAGFTIEPSSASLSKFSGTTVRQFTVKATPDLPRPGAYPVDASVRYTRDNQTFSEAARAMFTYRNGDISLAWYIAIALLGLSFGYIARVAVRLLSEVKPARKPAQQAGQESGVAEAVPDWLTRFVREHYLLVDFVVTLILGAAALISLARLDAPPLFATRVHTAFIAGMTIGFLTNSELITRLSARIPAR